jgi:hypothetical protein
VDAPVSHKNRFGAKSSDTGSVSLGFRILNWTFLPLFFATFRLHFSLCLKQKRQRRNFSLVSRPVPVYVAQGGQDAFVSYFHLIWQKKTQTPSPFSFAQLE